MNTPDKRIIVIGAGAAGLSLAAELLEKNSQVTLLEASDRVGGRILSGANQSETPIELGASLIDDKKLTLYQRAKAAGMLKKGRGKVYFIADGRMRSGFSMLFYVGLRDVLRINKLFKLFYQWPEADAPLTQLLEKTDTGERFNRVFSTTIGTATGTPIENVGVKSLASSLQKADIKAERDIAGLGITKPFIGLLAQEIVYVESCIHFNAMVTGIDYHQPDIKVSCANGETYQADKVVLTVPLSILKRGDIQFQPPLPVEKQTAIKQLGMGRGLKVALFFRQAFWKKSCDCIIDSDNDLMYFVHDSENQHILIAYSTSLTLCEKTDKEVTERILNYLAKVFSDEVHRSLDKVIVKNWYQDPFIGGSYSYDPPDSEGCRDQLAASIDNKLYFAGEATVNGHAGTVDGAVLSARNVLAEIYFHNSIHGMIH